MTTLSDEHDVTGLVLAGGRGSRMGGLDKGLQLHAGRPLALLALERLRGQVSRLAISANRNLEAYAAFGVPVWPDARPDFAGPLAGIAVALANCKTRWLVCVPCDTPAFPANLVARLSGAAAAHGADVALPCTTAADGRHWQPAFCLIRTSLGDDLQRHLDAGGRSIRGWVEGRRHVAVPFADAAAFENANTLADLARLQHARV